MITSDSSFQHTFATITPFISLYLAWKLSRVEYRAEEHRLSFSPAFPMSATSIRNGADPRIDCYICSDRIHIFIWNLSQRSSSPQEIETGHHEKKVSRLVYSSHSFSHAPNHIMFIFTPCSTLYVPLIYSCVSPFYYHLYHNSRLEDDKEYDCDYRMRECNFLLSSFCWCDTIVVWTARIRLRFMMGGILRVRWSHSCVTIMDLLMLFLPDPICTSSLFPAHHLRLEDRDSELTTTSFIWITRTIIIFLQTWHHPLQDHRPPVWVMKHEVLHKHPTHPPPHPMSSLLSLLFHPENW